MYDFKIVFLYEGVKSAVYMMFKPIEEMKKMTGSRDNYLGNRVVSAKMQDDVWRNTNSSFTLVFHNTQVISLSVLLHL